MAILLASGNPLGLRALGSGGRTAVTSYEQITRTLRQSLGPDHAALFAEPNRRASTLDWFTNVEAEGKPPRLVDAPEDRRQQGLAQLEKLVREIEAKAISMQKSDRQDERILGDMLAHALEIPDEDAVFLVGIQPVMTFWGYVRDKGKPAVAPLRSLLMRRAPDITPPQLNQTPPRTGSRLEHAPDTIVAESPPARSSGWIVPTILWTSFALLLLTAGVELLRGCAIGLPHSLTGWLLNYCPDASDTSTRSALSAERAKQDQLRDEYDELVRRTALKRQACMIRKTGKEDPQGSEDDTQPQPVVVHPPRPDKEKMVIPDKEKDKDKDFTFIEGCWRAQEGMTASTSEGINTGKKLKITYCFNKDGTGTRTVRYLDDGATCVGTAHASFSDQILTFDLGYASCDPQHLSFRTATDTCRRGDKGIATCTERPVGGSIPNFEDTPFTRTNEKP